MAVHRRVQIAEFTADDYWSRKQTRPAPADMVSSIKLPPNATKIGWYGVCHDGNDEHASPIDGTGVSFDACLVIARPGIRGLEYVRMPSVKEETTNELETGALWWDVDLPAGCEAWIQLIAITAGESTAPYLWLSYDFR